MTEAWRTRTTSVAALFCIFVFCIAAFGGFSDDGERLHFDMSTSETADRTVFIAPRLTDSDADESEEAVTEPTQPQKKKINASGYSPGGSNAALERAASTLGALTAVLGVFLALFLCARYLSRKNFVGVKGSDSAVEILDVARLDAKTELKTIRWQGLLILVARTPTGWTKLGERTESARESE